MAQAGGCPCIIIPGTGQSKVEELNENGERVRSLWPFDFEAKPLLKKLAPRALLMLITRRDCGFSKRAGRELEHALEPLSCNADSTRKCRVRVVSYPDIAHCTADEKRYIYKMVPLQGLAEKIGEENLFYFSYDIFGRTQENARLLREYIAKVKEQTGSERVNLIPVSMGATVALMYFELFGADCDVHRVVGVVPAYDGSVLLSDMMSGNLKLDNYGELLGMFLSKKETEKAMKALSLLPPKVIRSTVEELLNAVLRAVLLNSSSMWGLVPSAAYPEFREKYLADAEHAELVRWTDIHYNARKNIKKTVAREKERGVEFYNLCGCGLRLLPFAGSGDVSSDTIVDAQSATMGGRFDPIDKEGGKIQLEFAAVPERTWLYIGMEHEQAAENKRLLSLVEKLLTSECALDIQSTPEYPQFEIYNISR